MSKLLKGEYTPKIENQMEKKMENEMATGFMVLTRKRLAAYLVDSHKACRNAHSCSNQLFPFSFPVHQSRQSTSK